MSCPSRSRIPSRAKWPSDGEAPHGLDVLIGGLWDARRAGAAIFLGRVYIADDLGEFHLPMRNFYAEQLRPASRSIGCPACTADFT